MATIAELGQKVKAKYPGAYDDMDDAAVGRAVKAKFPGAYDDFTDMPAEAQESPPWKRALPYIGPIPYVLSKIPPGVDLSQKLGEGIPGFNRLSAAFSAAADPLIPGRTEEWGQDFGDRYGEHLRALESQSARTQSEMPLESTALQMLGGAPLALLGRAGTAAGRVGQGLEPLSRWARTKIGALEGGGLGTAYGAGSAPSDADLTTMAAHTVGGGVAGGVLGGGLSAMLPSHVPSVPGATLPASTQAATEAPGAVAASAPRAFLRSTLGKAKPIPEAEYLASRGVPLTRGLQDPRSSFAQVEQASQSLEGVGPAIRAQRQRALNEATKLVFNEARPPRTKPLALSNDINENFAALDAAWDTAYEGARGGLGRVYPAIHDGRGGIPLVGTATRPGAIEQALADPDLMASDQAKSVVGRFVANQFTKIPKPEGALGRVNAGDLLNIRSVLRKKGREMLRQQKWEEWGLLGAAEQRITDAIESQAPPKALATLRALDAKYRNFKIAEEIVYRAGDSPAGISPSNISSAIRSVNPNRNAYARGEGGDMRDLSRAIRTVFETVSPDTGSRLLTLAPKWLKETTVGPAVYLRNASAGVNAPSRLTPVPVPARQMTIPVGSAQAGVQHALPRSILSRLRLLQSYAEEDDTGN